MENNLNNAWVTFVIWFWWTVLIVSLLGVIGYLIFRKTRGSK